MLVSLLTDFGTADYFVGAMKGAILSVNEDARIVDITHEITPHDVHEGAWTLLAAYQTFPARTIHVAVVDPSVGSSRRPILITSGNYFFVGPDNGLFSYVIERESVCRVFHLTNDKYFRHPVSAVFHGRDLFAPVAGALLNGVEPAELGELITDYKRFPSLALHKSVDGSLEARIMHIDRFGNCITNITPSDLPFDFLQRGARLLIKEHEVHSFRRFYAENSNIEETNPNALFAVWGSAGFLEIAASCRSAAHLLGIERGERVTLVSRMI